MFTHFRSHQDGAALAAGGPLQVSALLGNAAAIVAGPHVAGSAPVDGTIGARIEAAERRFYPLKSDALICTGPVRPAPAPPVQRRILRARDLIGELHSINAQIHKIMFQVDKAVARLATGG